MKRYYVNFTNPELAAIVFVHAKSDNEAISRASNVLQDDAGAFGDKPFAINLDDPPGWFRSKWNFAENTVKVFRIPEMWK